MTAETTIPVVPAADDMDDDTFVLHFNKRHRDSLGGLTALRLQFLTPYVMECYRIFHERLHRVRIDLNHKHADEVS